MDMYLIDTIKELIAEGIFCVSIAALSAAIYMLQKGRRK